MAEDLTIVTKPVLILRQRESGSLVWEAIDESFESSKTAVELKEEYSLCMTGAMVKEAVSLGEFETMAPHVSVFARMSPVERYFPSNPLLQ